jgi:ProP effector
MNAKTNPADATPNATPNAAKTLLKELCSAFAVFKEGRPLAIGIHKSLVEKLPGGSPGALRQAMRLHTNSTRYLKALATGEVRFDLDGNPSGEVTPEQRDQAAKELRERFRREAERHRQEQQALERQQKLARLAEKFNTR